MCESGATVVDSSRHTHMQLRGTGSALKHSLLYSARAIQSYNEFAKLEVQFEDVRSYQ